MNPLILLMLLLMVMMTNNVLSLSSPKANKPVSPSSISIPFSLKNLQYKLSVISISLLSFTQHSAIAQIPTFDEYNTGSGTYIKPKISSTATQRDSSIQQQSFSKENIRSSLMRINDYIKKGQWDPILVEIKKISFISKRYYGQDKVLDETIENDREELNFILGQISDIALANRVIYFNIEDLKGVELLTSEESELKQVEAVKEASSCIENALKLFNTLNLDF